MNFGVFFTFIVLTSVSFSIGEMSNSKGTEKTVIAPRPIILVPGWGPHWLTSMSDLRKFFEEDGIPSIHLHEVSYPYKKDPETIRRSLTTQFQKIFSQYPEQTKFDFVAHSLGGFVTIYSLLESGLADKVQKYISLAGVAHGQTKDFFIKRSETHDYIIPAHNNFVTELYELHAEELSQIEKCSLWSLDDRLVNSPHDSGAFEGGLNIELKGYSHLDFIHKKSLYEIMVTNCY